MLTLNHTWRSPGFGINIKGSKFYNWQALKGGGGAIDLVMRVRDCGFRAAVGWLRDRFGEAATLEAVTQQVRKFFKRNQCSNFCRPWTMLPAYTEQVLLKRLE